MGYHISYDQTIVKTNFPDKKKFRIGKKQIKFGAICLIVVITAMLFRIKSVQNFLIPGDCGVTKSAFAAMVTNLQSGEPIADAVTTFCREIVENGYVSG